MYSGIIAVWLHDGHSDEVADLWYAVSANTNVTVHLHFACAFQYQTKSKKLWLNCICKITADLFKKNCFLMNWTNQNIRWRFGNVQFVFGDCFHMRFSNKALKRFLSEHILRISALLG